MKQQTVAGEPVTDVSSSPHKTVRERTLYKNGNGWNYPSYFTEEESFKSNRTRR